MRNDSDILGFIALFAVLFFGGLAVGSYVGCKTGTFDGREWTRQEAIKAGVAEWQVNPKTGETKFVWKGQAERSEP
jgi:hypothetical protein